MVEWRKRCSCFVSPNMVKIKQVLTETQCYNFVSPETASALLREMEQWKMCDRGNKKR
jgi:hypothetical protein